MASVSDEEDETVCAFGAEGQAFTLPTSADADDSGLIDRDARRYYLKGRKR